MEQHKIEGRGTAEQYLILKHEAGLTNAHKRITENDMWVNFNVQRTQRSFDKLKARIRTLETLFAVSGAISAGILLLTLFRMGVFG